MFLVPNFLQVAFARKLPSRATWTASLMEEEVPHGGPALGLASSQSEPVGCPGGSINHTSPPLRAAGPSLSTGSFTVVAQQEVGRCSEPSLAHWEPRLQVPWSRSHGRALASAFAVGSSSLLLQLGVGLQGERLLWVLSTVTCLAAMTRRQGGGVPFVESGFPCRVLPQWLQAKWQRRESLHETGTGRHPVDAKPFSVQLWEFTPPPKKGKIGIQLASPPVQWGLAPGSGPCEGGPWTQLGLVLRKLAVSLICCLCDGIRGPSLPKKLSIWGFVWFLIFVWFWFKYVPLFLFLGW